MIFYFSHDVEVEMGPTVILPYTQYSTNTLLPKRGGELNVRMEAGTCMLVHYNLWHRGSINKSTKVRCMVKLQFLRMDPPTAGSPSWNHKAPEWKYQIPPGPLQSVVAPLLPVWQYVWRWYLGLPPLTQAVPADVSAYLRTICIVDKDSIDPEALGASYTLATLGDSVIPQLVKILRTDKQWDHQWFLNKRSGKRAATHSPGMYAALALGAMAHSPSRDSAILSLMLDGTIETESRTFALYAASFQPISNPEVVKAVIRFLEPATKEHITVIRMAVEALRAVVCTEFLPDIVRLLVNVMSQHPDEQSRFTAALSLATLVPVVPSMNPSSDEYEIGLVGESVATSDPNRYVRGFALVAASRARDLTALATREVMETRRCPLTSPSSQW
jgi:hypothetical protein